MGRKDAEIRVLPRCTYREILTGRRIRFKVPGRRPYLIYFLDGKVYGAIFGYDGRYCVIYAEYIKKMRQSDPVAAKQIHNTMRKLAREKR